MRKALSDIITQISPRADAERTADFLRGLYDTRGEGGAGRARQAAGRERARCSPRPRRARRRGMPVPLSLLESGSTKLQFPKEDDPRASTSPGG